MAETNRTAFVFSSKQSAWDYPPLHISDNFQDQSPDQIPCGQHFAFPRQLVHECTAYSNSLPHPTWEDWSWLVEDGGSTEGLWKLASGMGEVSTAFQKNGFIMQEHCSSQGHWERDLALQAPGELLCWANLFCISSVASLGGCFRIPCQPARAPSSFCFCTHTDEELQSLRVTQIRASSQVSPLAWISAAFTYSNLHVHLEVAAGTLAKDLTCTESAQKWVISLFYGNVAGSHEEYFQGLTCFINFCSL